MNTAMRSLLLGSRNKYGGSTSPDKLFHEEFVEKIKKYETFKFVKFLF